MGAEFEGMGRLLRCFALIQLLHRDVNSPKIRAKALFSEEPTSRARIFITLRLAFSICPSPRILRQLPAGIPKKRKGERNSTPRAVHSQSKNNLIQDSPSGSHCAASAGIAPLHCHVLLHSGYLLRWLLRRQS